jgi:hypothetical protein
MRAQGKDKTRSAAVLAMAATTVIASAVSHAQVTLNLYYGQDLNYANSNNGIIVGNGSNSSGIKIGGTKTNATGGLFYFQHSTEQTVDQNVPTTITVPVGDYLSLAVDAVLTGNPNPDAGINSIGQPGATQPAYLGLNVLSLGESSTDTSGSILTPISTDPSTHPLSSYAGEPTYHSTAVINSYVVNPIGPVDRLPQNAPTGTNYTALPVWGTAANVNAAADVQPNEPGYDAGHGNGNVGLNGYTTGGNTLPASTSASGIATLEQFASSNNTANYASAIDFYNSLIFQGLQPGEVTLTPYLARNASSYWVLASHGTNQSVSITPSGTTTTQNGIPSQYTNQDFTSADTINSPPNLVIVVSAPPVPEPACGGLLAVAALGLMTRRNRFPLSRVS